jgi:leucine dehydrogenase
MTEFDNLEKNGHEQLVFCSNKAIGLRAVIAIHSTTLGPSLGGVRMWNYSAIDNAIRDVLGVSKAMTYKASISGLNLGGSNCTIGDPVIHKNELLLREIGKIINTLGGKFYAIQDIGTNEKDMKILKNETKYVTGLSKQNGGSGDPSPFTAYGVWVGMKACAKVKWGNDSLLGKKVAIQGLAM